MKDIPEQRINIMFYSISLFLLSLTAVLFFPLIMTNVMTNLMTNEWKESHILFYNMHSKVYLIWIKRIAFLNFNITNFYYKSLICIVSIT
jgi:hypothetical protein